MMPESPMRHLSCEAWWTCVACGPWTEHLLFHNNATHAPVQVMLEVQLDGLSFRSTNFQVQVGNVWHGWNYCRIAAC